MFEYELDPENGKKASSVASDDGFAQLNQEVPISTSSLSTENLDKVKTRQRREPQPKLDANRLLQPNGLMYIKEKGPKLKFKGKGHEFEDLQHLLDFYQLWCHQLFPKRRFPDAIRKIESLCSERRLKVFREELIKTEISNRGIAPGVQIQIDSNRPDTLTEWNFGDNENTVNGSPEEGMPTLIPDSIDEAQMTDSNGDIEVDQLHRIRENRERALARLAARKRSRALEIEEREVEAHKLPRTEEVSDSELPVESAMDQ